MTICNGREGYDSTREFIDRTDRAKHDESFRVYEMRPPSIESEFFSTLKKACTGKRVLDVGCGYGKWAELLAPVSEYYMGIDVVPARIENCRSLALPASFIVISGNQWELLRKFDVIFTATVLQHLTLPDAVETLRTISKHLDKDGSVFLRESLFIDGTESEAEELYARKPQHMIPKPLSVLKEAVPQFHWNHISRNEYILKVL